MSISSTREEEGGEADSGKAATGRAVADRRASCEAPVIL